MVVCVYEVEVTHQKGPGLRKRCQNHAEVVESSSGVAGAAAYVDVNVDESEGIRCKVDGHSVDTPRVEHVVCVRGRLAQEVVADEKNHTTPGGRSAIGRGWTEGRECFV